MFKFGFGVKHNPVGKVIPQIQNQPMEVHLVIFAALSEVGVNLAIAPKFEFVQSLPQS